MAWVYVNPIFVESVAIFNMCKHGSFPGQKVETAGINVVIIVVIIIIIIIIIMTIIIVILIMMMMMIKILIIQIIKWR